MIAQRNIKQGKKELKHIDTAVTTFFRRWWLNPTNVPLIAHEFFTYLDDEGLMLIEKGE